MNREHHLQPGKDHWAGTRARQARVLQNGAAYFKAVRQAMLQARHSIFIIGWDIDSRVELLRGEDNPGDGSPITLAEVLSDVIERRSGLEVFLLIWDYSVVFAPERENLPRLNWSLLVPERLHLCLDDTMAIGASYHQKIVVIDDSLAFCGGLDLTNNRWDRVEHRLEEPARHDPTGKPFAPYHDLQMMVSGEAAGTLGTLARQRWDNASNTAVPGMKGGRDLWPASIKPDFEDIPLKIARTVAKTATSPCKDEIQQRYLQAIATAEEFIYIENQYLASETIGRAIVERMLEKPRLRLIALTTITPSYGWFETYSMAVGRASFRSMFHRAGLDDRVLILYPVISAEDGSETVKVHSKLMIIDNRYLQLGSANISNRSMRVDNECDLAISVRNKTEEKQLARILHRLLAEYLQQPTDAIEQALQKRTVYELISDNINQVPGFKMIGEDRYESQLSEVIRPLADPASPLVEPRYLSFADKGRGSARSLNNIYRMTLLIGLLILIASMWKWTPLADWIEPQNLEPLIQKLQHHQLGAVIMVSIFVIGGMVFFPVTLMIALTAAVFGPVYGFFYALLGSLLSAVASFAIGDKLNRSFLHGLLKGKKFRRINRLLSEYGIFSVVFVRMVPVAPFTIVNLAAGMSSINLRDFIYGTLLGMAPGILMLALVGDRLNHLWQEPSLHNMAITGGAILGWLGISFLLQRMINRWRLNHHNSGHAE